MKHSSTRELFEYWNMRRGVRFAPERGEIEPGAIRRALGDSFILAVDPDAGHPFRLAGTRICALFCRELKSEPFARMWERDSKPSFDEVLKIVTDDAAGVVAGVTGHAGEDLTIDLELMLLPLSQGGRTHLRMIGALAPLSVPYWLGVHPVDRLELRTLRHMSAAMMPAARSRLMQRAEGTRPSLVVHQGGRS